MLMNRGLWLFALFFCYAGLSFSQSKKDIKTYRIKSITETVTEIYNGKEITRKDSYTSYDKSANITSNTEYRKDGTPKLKESTKYDSKGNKTEEIIWEAAEIRPNPEKNVKCISRFDSDDNKTEMFEYKGTGELVARTQYSYNSNGNKILEVVYDASDKLIKKIVYLYNAKGLRVEKKEYDGNNVLLSDRKYIYEF